MQCYSVTVFPLSTIDSMNIGHDTQEIKNVSTDARNYLADAL